jgi:hypothetical protein
MKPKKVSSIIVYPHLVELVFAPVHIDYVEQFLFELNTYLPSLSKLHVDYKHLVTVTENFTRITTRINYTRLKQITFTYGEHGVVRSKNFYSYFPRCQ